MASPLTAVRFHSTKADGTDNAAGKIYTYAAGTTTPQATYTTAGGGTPNANPVILDSTGRASIYLAPGLAYKFVCQDSAGATVPDGTVDNWSDTGDNLRADMASTATAKGASLVGIFDTGGYYTGTTVEAALQEAAVAVSAPVALTTGRTAPHANFNWFTTLWTVIGSPGPGRAGVLQDIRDVFLTKYTAIMTGGFSYVDGTNGSDANTGGIADPWATLDKAIRTSISGRVIVMPGTYAWTGFRYTDTQGIRPKTIEAAGGPTVTTITVAGDTVSAAVFASTGGGTANTYSTTLVTTNHVIRLIDNSRLDEMGLGVPMPKYSSLATVDAAGYGWWYNSATRILYVRVGVLNVNGAYKANLKAIYATGGDNIILINAAIVYLEGFTLDGGFNVANVVAQTAPEVWAKNCTIRYAEGNSRNVYGGNVYSQGCTYYRSAADHGNYNISNSVVSNGAEINDTTLYAGDADTYGSGATQPNNPISTGQNKNGSSNHDSYVVRINGTHSKSYGPPIADTATSYSWCLGTTTGYSFATAGAGQRYGFIMQGNNAWLDGCQTYGGNEGFNSDSSAVVRTFNCLGPKVTSSSGTFSAYVPA